MKILCMLPDIVGSRGGIQRHLYDVIETLSEEHLVTYISKCSVEDEVTHSASENVKEIHLGRIPFFQNVLFVWNAFWQMLRNKPDCCVVGHIHYCPFVHRFCRYFNIPYIVFAYGVECWSFLGEKYKRGLQGAERIVTISNFTARKLEQEYGLSSDRISIIPCAVSPDRIPMDVKNRSLRSTLGIPDQALILLSVGRVDSRESFHPYDVLLRILPEIRQRLGEVHYVHVGTGSDLERLKEHTLNNLHVHFTGFVSDAELPAYYNMADVFVYPSKLEGFGIVFLEALLSGTPIVTGKYDGSAEIVAHVPFGVSADPDDERDVVEGIISVLEQKRDGQYDALKMREQVLRVYGPQSLKHHLNSLLRELSAT